MLTRNRLVITACAMLLMQMFFIFKTNAQARIEGSAPGVALDTAHLSYPVNDTYRDDIIIIRDGKFVWEGHVQEPLMARLSSSTTNIGFFIENKKLKLTIGQDSSTLTGSAVHDECMDYERSRQSLLEEYYRLDGRLGKMRDSSEAAKLVVAEMLDKVDMQLDSVAYAFIRRHPSSYVSLHVLEDLSAIDAEFNVIDKLFRSLNSELRNSFAGKRISTQMLALKKRSRGESFASFSQKDINGKTVTLSDLKGKYVLVDFWASWCGPCRAENPNVLKAYNKYKDKNFTVLGVSLDNDDAKWRKAVKEDNMPWLQVRDVNGYENPLKVFYTINAIPYTFLIDPKGKIIATNVRGVKLHKKLREILKS